MKNLAEVLSLREKVEQEYRRRIKTIDDFINLYKELEGEFGEPAQKDETAKDTPPQIVDHSTPPQISENLPKRLTGLRTIGVSIFQDLADKFTKFDVCDVIERARPELRGKITRDSLDGVMKEFVRRELAIMIVANSGRKPAIYRKAQSSGGFNFSLDQVSVNTEKGLEDVASINQAVTN